MPPNYSSFSPYTRPDNASPSQTPSARSSGSPGWPDSQNESSALHASQPAPSAPLNTTQYHNPTNARYHSSQHSVLVQSPHSGVQPVMYPVSSQRTQMNGDQYPSTQDTFPRPNEPRARGPGANRDSDPPRMPVSRRPAISSDGGSYSPATPQMNAYHPHHRPGSLTVSPPNQVVSPSHHHPSLHLPATQQMNSMLSEFSISSPTFSSSSSSASPASPYFDRTSVRPSMSTMEMRSNSLEAVDDPESHSTFNSLIRLSGDTYSFTNDNTTDGFRFDPHSASAMNDGHSNWSRPSAGKMRDRAYGAPPRSASSQSSASHSTSESESSTHISSLPIGMGTSGRPSNSASTSFATATPRKNKMHQCTMCPKSFPRPSGLETHMNSHTGAKRTPTVPSLICCPLLTIMDCSTQVSVTRLRQGFCRPLKRQTPPQNSRIATFVC